MFWVDRSVFVWAVLLAASGVVGLAALDAPALVVGLPVGLAGLIGLWAARRATRRIRSEPSSDSEGGQAADAQAVAGRLISGLPTPLVVIGPDGMVVLANDEAQTLLPGLRKGAHFANVIRAPAFVQAVQAVLNGAPSQATQFALGPGREQVLSARLSVLPGGRRRTRLVIALIEDRTEARRLEQMRTDFIANASHELRTPLASIAGYIETLQGHAREDPEARERFLAIMAREAGRMQRLVEGLMSLSRIELVEHLRPREVWSVWRIAEEAASSLEPLAAAEGVRLIAELPESGGLVTCDRDQIHQVVVNLVENAIKYGGQGCTVRLSAAVATPGAGPARIGIEVSDSGPGIAAEHLPRLTERFYRVNTGGGSRNGGSGLGLAIVKHIVNRHAGRLEIRSVEGVGSRFIVWLPPADAAALHRATAEGQDGAGSRTGAGSALGSDRPLQPPSAAPRPAAAVVPPPAEGTDPFLPVAANVTPLPASAGRRASR